MPRSSAALRWLDHSRTDLLVSFGPDGKNFSSVLPIAVLGGRPFLRIPSTSPLVSRLEARPFVLVAPSTLEGRALSSRQHARATRLEGEEAHLARRVLARRYPLLGGLLPLLLRPSSTYWELSDFSYSL